MTIDRRTLMTGLAAAVAGLTLAAPRRARADADTLAQIKQRGSLSVGVTQAPPWYSKEPKTGEWASGVGVSLGKAIARGPGGEFEPGDSTWGLAVADRKGGVWRERGRIRVREGG